MLRSFLDHITVTALSLEAGAELVAQSLGVTPQAGGEHPRMATHNLLLRLGQATFLGGDRAQSGSSCSVAGSGG
jgi:hypothetical protein